MAKGYDPDFLNGRIFEVVDALEEGFAVLDAAGVVQFVNPAAVRMLSIDAEGVLGERLLDLPWEIEGPDGTVIPKESHPSLVALSAGEDRGAEVLGVTSPTFPGRRWLEVTARPLRSADGGAVDGSVALFRDIGARRAAERALRSSELRFETLTSLVPVGIFLNDLDGRCSYVNEAYCRIAGCTAEQALGEGWVRALHPDDQERVWRHWLEAADSGGEFRSEYRFQHPDGEVRWVMGAAVVHRSASGEATGFLGSVTDVTDQKAAAIMKDQLIGMVSHELRAPLVAIGGALGHLEPHTTEFGERDRELYDMAVRNTRFLERLVTAMLEVERMEGGATPLHTEAVRVADLLKEAVGLVDVVEDEAGVTIEVSAPDPGLQVDVDRDRMLQVLANLISNAVKFSAGGTTVTVEAEAFRNEVVFAVRDQGRGIAEHLTDRIFERFVRVEPLQEGTASGAGLGLSIAKAIVARHGGRIWVDSTLGEGSTFRFAIPFRPPPA